MWKIHLAVISNLLMALSALARPQDIQIEKQEMLEIPFDEFNNARNSEQSPLFNLVDSYFNSASDNEYYQQSKFNNFKNNLNVLKNFNDDFSLKSDNVKPFSPARGSELLIRPLPMQRRQDENEVIENLIPPSQFAPITSYSKPIKAVLEDQLRNILAQYRNLPKSDPSSFENTANYETNLRTEDERRLISFNDDQSKDSLDKAKTKSKNRIEKAMKITNKKNLKNEEMFEKLTNDGNGEEASAVEVNAEMFLPENTIKPEDILERIILKKGGIAIVGPKGIATAETGGTAIVGPNGVAYTKPNGVAIVGPGSRVVSLPTETDLNKLVYELYKQQSKHPEKLTAKGVDGQFVFNNDGNNIKKVFLPIGGKIVATGPAIYHDVEDPNSVIATRDLQRRYQMSFGSNDAPHLTLHQQIIHPISFLGLYQTEDQDFGLPIDKKDLMNKALSRIDSEDVVFNKGDRELLILKPSAFTLAQDKGTAISNPIARAVKKSGKDADIIFDPSAVAISGAGGIAHAQLTNSPQVIGLPYYGGAKGQLLQITTDQNGAILSQTIVPEPVLTLPPNSILLPDKNVLRQQFTQSFNALQSSAKKLVDLQQKVKRTGQLQPTDRLTYSTNLALLGQSASLLAQLEGQDSQDLAKFFATQGGQNVNRQSSGTDEEDVGEELDVPEEDGGSTATTPDDTVAINGPPDTASVAEAKPVGVAIAGEGGVASSKPAATAIVGPGGLAIARPVATALSGVEPSKVGFGTKFPSLRVRDRVDSKLANRFN